MNVPRTREIWFLVRSDGTNGFPLGSFLMPPALPVVLASNFLPNGEIACLQECIAC